MCYTYTTTDTNYVTVLELGRPNMSGPVLCSPKQLFHPSDSE